MCFCCAACYAKELRGHCRHCTAAQRAEDSVWKLTITVPGLKRLEQQVGAAGGCNCDDHWESAAAEADMASRDARPLAAGSAKLAGLS